MKQFLLILLVGLLINQNVFGQGLGDIGIDNNPTLTEKEGEFLNDYLEKERGQFDLKGKKVSFISGSSGTVHLTKQDYFNNIKKWAETNSRIATSLIILDETEKLESGGYDVILTAWVKLLTPKRKKKILNELKIKQIPVKTISDNNKDVWILTGLIQDHFRKQDDLKSNELDLNLDQIIENDSLKRISKNFKKLELNMHGGHISVHYSFSDLRKIDGIELTDKEKEITKYYKWTAKELKLGSDGEIRFEYGERFYRVIKITVNTKN